MIKLLSVKKSEKFKDAETLRRAIEIETLPPKLGTSFPNQLSKLANQKM